MLDRGEAPDHQTGAGEQHERERHLGNDQGVPESSTRAGYARSAATAFLECFMNVGADRVASRRHTEQQARADRDDAREGKHAPIDRHIGQRLDCGDTARHECDERLRALDREHEANGSSDHGEQHALGE